MKATQLIVKYYDFRVLQESNGKSKSEGRAFLNVFLYIVSVNLNNR